MSTLLGGGALTSSAYSSPLLLNLPWRPRTTLSVLRSNHPFNSACSTQSLTRLQCCCQRNPGATFHPPHPFAPTILIKEMRELLSHNSATTDSILTAFLTILTNSYDITFLSTHTLPVLRQHGWQSVERWFSSHLSQSRPRAFNRPYLTGGAAKIIPCFVGNCHWVVIVCVSSMVKYSSYMPLTSIMPPLRNKIEPFFPTLTHPFILSQRIGLHARAQPTAHIEMNAGHSPC